MTETEAVAGAQQRHELRTLQRTEYNMTVSWWWRCWCDKVGSNYSSNTQAKAAHGRHRDLSTEGHT